MIEEDNRINGRNPRINEKTLTGQPRLRLSQEKILTSHPGPVSSKGDLTVDLGTNYDPKKILARQPRTRQWQGKYFWPGNCRQGA